MSLFLPRRLELEGGCNVRDLGGHSTLDGRRVRHGLLFRSGVLTFLSASDHDCLAELGIKTIVDLRSPEEIASEPTRWPRPVRNLSWPEHEAMAATRREAPWEHFSSGEQARAWLLQSYRNMGEWLAPQLRGIFRAVIEDEIPLIFHCAAGKDRTGICAAVLLGILGVPRETILEEFAFTDEAVDLDAFTRRHRGSRTGASEIHTSMSATRPDVRKALMAADRDYLAAALEGIAEAHGSISGFAEKVLEIGEKQQAMMRDRLLET